VRVKRQYWCFMYEVTFIYLCLCHIVYVNRLHTCDNAALHVAERAYATLLIVCADAAYLLL
jgi:hypothetical protein